MLQAALDALAAPDLRLKRVSPVYETEPLEVRSQPWFLNAVVEAEADVMPRSLLGRIQRLERKLGRRRTVPKGPRSIDIDILLFGNFVVKAPDLEIPHPRIGERRFVLEPMAALAPQLRHPVTRRTIAEMLAAAPSQAIRKSDCELKLPLPS
jgi:2-amino-4-hydroxy-6-hydroxymethyldihydropteridine diphosphokinase